jgi:hypothetical protein
MTLKNRVSMMVVYRSLASLLILLLALAGVATAQNPVPHQPVRGLAANRYDWRP